MTRAAGFALESVGLRFGATTALDGIDLEIRPGEAVALVGPSGAGKTSLLRLMNGTCRASAGGVRVGQRALARCSPSELRQLRAEIGFVHQDLNLVPTLRVAQNVISGRLGRRRLLPSLLGMLRPGRAELREVHALLARVGIEDKLFERTDRLSGGQQQRVAIARALHQRPSALLADEPVSSVDPARARDTISLLTDISREQRLTLVASLHSLELARAFFPRLIGLRDGRILFDRPSADVGDAELHALYDLADLTGPAARRGFAEERDDGG